MVETKEFENDKLILPQTFDFIVIGASEAGVACATRAAQLGKNVAIVEHGPNYNGAGVKKLMWHAANYVDECRVMGDNGIEGTECVKLDWRIFKHKRDTFLTKFDTMNKEKLQNCNVCYFEGAACVVAAGTVTTSERKVLNAPHIVIACCGSVGTPENCTFEGIDLCIRPAELLKLESLPDSLVVLGSDAMAVELAQIMHALGVRTTLIAQDNLLENVDKDIVEVLTEQMNQSGLDLKFDTPVSSVTQADDWGKLQVNCDAGAFSFGWATFTADKVLCTAKGAQMTDSLNLRAIGVKMNEDTGCVAVDEFQNTSVQGLYAVGDVTGKCHTAVAVRSARMLAERLVSGKDGIQICQENVAHVVFSQPTIAYVGLSEQAAIDKFGLDNVKVYKSTFKSMYYALASDEKKQATRMKLICHK